MAKAAVRILDMDEFKAAMEEVRERVAEIEAARDRYRKDAEVMHRNYHHMREERDRLRTWIISARNALADGTAMEEEIDSPANMAFAILNHALNQEEPNDAA